MSATTRWMANVREELKKHPLASTLFFGFISVVLEKMVEIEFACPCIYKTNTVFALLYFLVPPIIIFLLMFNTEEFRCNRFFQLCKKALISCIIPATTWLVIVFIDGRYLACMCTTWSGKYEIIANAAPQKWCRPQNISDGSEVKTQRMYAISQAVGFLLAVTLTVVGQMRFCCGPEQTADPEVPFIRNQNTRL